MKTEGNLRLNGEAVRSSSHRVCMISKISICVIFYKQVT